MGRWVSVISWECGKPHELLLCQQLLTDTHSGFRPGKVSVHMHSQHSCASTLSYAAPARERSTPQSLSCEGGVDVVGVVTPLVRGGAQVVLHGDQVVELSVLLGVHEKREVEEDGEDQVEVERKEGEVKEKRSCMTMNVDEMRLKNTLIRMVHVTQHQSVTKTTRSQCVLTGCATCACRCSCTCC